MLWWLVAIGLAVASVSCGAKATGVADDAQEDECESITLDSYCAEASCASLDERLLFGEEVCERGFGSLAHVVVTGCGFTEIRSISPSFSNSLWFDSDTSDIVGLTYLSDSDPECSGTFIGEKRPSGCKDVSVSECSICGWDTCEWLTCEQEIANCVFGFPCAELWECSQRTGCREAECADEEVCSGFSLSDADFALMALSDLLQCVEESSCSSSCPRSFRE